MGTGIEVISQGGGASISPSATQTVTGAGTTTINAAGSYFYNIYSTSNATATTIAYSNINDGATITWDYLKTTSSNLVITFPAGTVISVGSDAVVSGLTATLNSTNAGRFTLTIQKINTTYKVYITQDVL